MPVFDVRSIWKDASLDSQAYHCSPLLHFHWQSSHDALQMSCDLLEMLSGSCVKDMFWPEEQRAQEPTASHMRCSSQKRSSHVHSQWDTCKGLRPLVHWPLSLSAHDCVKIVHVCNSNFPNYCIKNKIALNKKMK